MTQVAIAAKAGCTPVLISNIKSGARNLTDDMAKHLAKAMRVRVEYLLGRDEYKSESEKCEIDSEYITKTFLPFHEYLLAIGVSISLPIEQAGQFLVRRGSIEKTLTASDIVLFMNNVRKSVYRCFEDVGEHEIEVDEERIMGIIAGMIEKQERGEENGSGQFEDGG
jgi:transcriptional regulator with XRE-family HTH domain